MPPELLNLAVEVLDDGRARISWYTSESATESISLDGVIIHTDEFATKKNHEHITTVLSDGDYTLLVTSADASGNSKSSTIEFIVDVGAPEDADNSGDNADSVTPGSSNNEDETASDISSTTLQIAVLAVVFLLIVAFIRVSSNDKKDDDKWS